eukprot:1149864-Pelagomonas_calceolata.AAC.1
MKTPSHGRFHLTSTMPSKDGHMPPKRKWPLSWTMTPNTYTFGAPPPSLTSDIFCCVHHIALSSIFLGVSICHPIYDDKAKTLALRHAICSAILNTEAAATFMLLPTSATPSLLQGTLLCPNKETYQTFPLDKKQIAKAPHEPAAEATAPTPCQSNISLLLIVAGWRSWDYTDGSCQVQKGKTVIGAGVYHPMSDFKILVEPICVGITNTMGRAGLAAIAATHIATDSFSSLHQLKKQILYPEKHRHHAQEKETKTTQARSSCVHLEKVF